MRYQSHSYYHIYNRGAHKKKIFFSKEQYVYCLKLLNKYADKYAVYILAYCLMPNHYHLVLQQNENGSISKFIQTSFNAFSQTINLLEQHSGTLFQGKAKAKLIDSDESVVHVIRYLHLNPVKAGLVKRPEDWPFSDYCEWVNSHSHLPKVYLGLKRPSEGFQRFRDSIFTDGKEYERFVDEYRNEVQNNKLEKFLFKED